jgi:hypothetical protein
VATCCSRVQGHEVNRLHLSIGRRKQRCCGSSGTSVSRVSLGDAERL